jgi:hypothetical protein
VSLEQAVVAAYSLSQAVKLEPKEGTGTTLGTTIGGREEYNCATCDDGLKQDRGGCPFVAQSKRAEIPQIIDSTGDDNHDLLHRCPRGLLLESPALVATLHTYNEAVNCGVPAYFKPPLCEKSKGFTRTLSVLVAAESRLQLQVTRERRRLDSAKVGR